MDLRVIQTGLDTVVRFINSIKNNFTNFYTTKSLSEATKLTRVEPLTIISKDLLNLEYLPDVTNSVLSIFAGYYLQAVSLLTKVNNVEVVRILDKLNPDRDESALFFSDTLSTESNTLLLDNYTYRLPTKQNSIAIEDSNDGGKQDTKQILELSNLSVGKLLNVEIAYGNNDLSGNDKDAVSKPGYVTIPISVRLAVSILPNPSIQSILAMKTEDSSLVERYHAWRGGRISFIKDLIFCQDLIDEFKRANIGDDTGTIQEIIRRVNNSKKFGLLTKNPSLVSASNIFIISEEVAREVEQKLGGKLSNPKIRQKAFESTYAMLICVVDREWERVTFYSRGISASTDLSIKEIKSSNKSKGPDITDIMKAFNMGMAPSF